MAGKTSAYCPLHRQFPSCRYFVVGRVPPDAEPVRISLCRTSIVRNKHSAREWRGLCESSQPWSKPSADYPC